MAADGAAVCGASGSSNERALAHSRVLLEWREAVHVLCVHLVELIAPVTGSLFFVAPVCRLAELNDCVIVLHVSRAYADSLLYIVGSDCLLGPFCGRDGDWDLV